MSEETIIERAIEDETEPQQLAILKEMVRQSLERIRKVMHEQQQ